MISRSGKLKLIIGLCSASFLLSCFVISKPSLSFKVDAAGLPTTINLNAVSETDIRSYYSSLNSLANNERKGTNLLKNLKPILRNNFAYFSYDNVWKIYEITDRNWTLSPASSTTYGTYDPSLNIITDYEYYSTLSTKKNNPYIHLLYVNNNNDPETALKIQDSHSASSTNPDAINREHCWPQSYGFKASSGAQGPAGTDLHHLIAADAGVNTKAHNNYCYGKVQTNNTMWANEIVKRTKVSLNKCGDAKVTYPEERKDASTCIFEPQDSDKGDIARALFYMCAMYNNLANESGVISSYDPYLSLSNHIYEDGFSISSTDTEPATYGTLEVLLEWNRLDPPDEYEIHRNDLIQRNYQHNRNPFIDFPSWPEYIWGTKSGYASPSSDLIYKFEQDTRILTNLEIIEMPSKLEYLVGEKISLAGANIKATFDDGTSENVATKCTVSPETISSKDTTQITITYTHNGVSKNVSVNIKVVDKQNSQNYIVIIGSILGAITAITLTSLGIANKKHKPKKRSKTNKK